MNLDLSLTYDLAPGWLAPYINGLRAGQAVAARCTGCDRVSFPPLRICPCGGRATLWANLPGTASLRFRSTGSDGDFALVAFDGASGLAVARLDGFGPDAQHGQISAANGPRPGLVLRPMTGEPA